MPLWRMEAGSASELMRVFYENVGKGRPKDEALRDAKLRLLRKGVPPHEWAGLVLHGDADSPVRSVLSWLQFTGIGAAMAALLTLYFRRRRLH